MADISQQQYNEMIDKITKAAGDLGKVAKIMVGKGGSEGNSGERSSSARRLRSDLSKMDRLRDSTIKITSKLNSSSANLADSFTNLTGSAQDFSNKLNNILAGMVGGYLLGRLIDGATRVATTYQRLTEVGQTFNGSMIEMAQQAGAAGLTLDDFAKLIESSSNAAAILSRNGSGGLGALALQVRRNTEQFGLYGMTMDQLNELTGDYVENLRLQGMLDQGNDASRAQSIQQFAEEVSTFAVLTGKARRDIIRDAREALRDTAATSRLRATGDATQRRALEQATLFLASIPGEAGAAMSQMISQTFGFGTALFAEGAQTFYEAGMGSIVSQFDRLGQRIARGEDVTDEMFNFAQEFADQVDANREGLRIQAMAGNQSARAILRQRDQIDAMVNLTEQQRRQMREQVRTRDQMTRFATSFNSVFSRIVGALRSGIFEGLGRAAEALGEFLNSGDMDAMEQSFKSFGQALGGFVSDVLTPTNIRRIGDLFITFGTTVGTIMRDVFNPGNLEAMATNIGYFIWGVTWLASSVISIGGTLVNAITSVYNGIRNTLREFGLSDTFAANVSAVTVGFGTLAAFLVGGSLLRALTNRLGVVTMTAGVVNLMSAGPGILSRAATWLGGAATAAGGAATAAGATAAGGIASGATAAAGTVSAATGAITAAGLGTAAAALVPLAAVALLGAAEDQNVRADTRANGRRRMNERGIQSGFGGETAAEIERRLYGDNNAVERPATRNEITNLENQYRRLQTQLETERAVNNGAETNRTIELLAELTELTRQIERRRSSDAERQVRATENIGQ